jgi:hypothetical protein
MRKPSSAVWVITAASLAYATLRYNVFKGVAWSDWPVFVLNKGLALSSLLLLVAWILRARPTVGAPQTALLAAASRMMLAHIGLSLVLLTPVYFPAFFESGRLTWKAGAAILLGVMATSGLSVAVAPVGAAGARRRALGLVSLAAGSHAALFGHASWLTPSEWPGYLVPITLISFLAGLVGIVAALGWLTEEEAR